MSREPGRVERAILSAFRDDPDNAFTVADLCYRAYPGIRTIESPDARHRQRTSVLRAMKWVASRSNDYGLLESERRLREAAGSTLIIYDQANVLSYAMARLKGGYGTDEFDPQYDANPFPWSVTAETLRAQLAEGQTYHDGRSWPKGRHTTSMSCPAGIGGVMFRNTSRSATVLVPPVIPAPARVAIELKDEGYSTLGLAEILGVTNLTFSEDTACKNNTLENGPVANLTFEGVAIGTRASLARGADPQGVASGTSAPGYTLTFWPPEQ
jgi:hypothetical protein